MKRILVKCKTVPIETKTRVIIGIFSIVIVLLSLLSVMFLEVVKNDFDTLFDKRMASIAKLNELKDYFGTHLADTVQDVQDGYLSKQTASKVLSQASTYAVNNWSEYKRLALSKHEDRLGTQLFKNVLRSIKSSKIVVNFHLTDEKILSDISDAISGELALVQGYIDGKPIANDVISGANSISSRLSQQIDLNLQYALIEKQNTDRLYSMGLKMIVLVFCIGFLSAVISAFVLLRSIGHLHASLEDSIEEKTRELSQINDELESRVAKEVFEHHKKEAIMHSQARLAAMGEMIANIAHQWRQPLNALTTIVQSFKLKSMNGPLDNDFIEHQVGTGLKIAQKMSDTIDDFRNFFKPDSQKEHFSLNETINKSISLFRIYTKGERIDVHFSPTSDFVLVGHPSRLSQLILNIFNNALDAITISKASDPSILIKVKKTIIDGKSFVKIRVVDNGGGIPKGIEDRIFEPYFTLKHKASGTGLGLYMAKQIVDEYNDGFIGVKNICLKTQTCAMFTIILPYEKEDADGGL